MGEADQATTANALQCARRDQHLDRGRGRAKNAANHRNRQGNYHHAPTTKRVAKPAIDRGGYRYGDQINHNHPSDQLDATERRDNDRKGGGNDRLTDHSHQHWQEYRGEEGEEPSLTGWRRLRTSGGQCGSQFERISRRRA